MAGRKTIITSSHIGIMNPINVLIASNSLIVRDGIEALLADQESLVVVGKVDADKRVLEAVESCEPHVLVFHAHSLKDTPIDILEPLRKKQPGLAILVTGYPREVKENSVLDLLHRGVNGYVCERETVDDLIMAIRTVAMGDTYLCRAATNVVLKQYRQMNLHPTRSVL